LFGLRTIIYVINSLSVLSTVTVCVASETHFTSDCANSVCRTVKVISRCC